MIKAEWILEWLKDASEDYYYVSKDFGLEEVTIDGTYDLKDLADFLNKKT